MLPFLSSVITERLAKPFIGAFAELRKATNSFVMSVRPSVRPLPASSSSDPNEQIFRKFDVCVFFFENMLIKFAFR